MMNPRYGMVITPLIIAACASTPAVDRDRIVQSAFNSQTASVPIVTEAQFREAVVDTTLILVSGQLKANLKFDSNNTASGLLVRHQHPAEKINLDWLWVDSGYCRTGMVGSIELENKCETVELTPDVGIRLTYTDGSSPDEYWLFDDYHSSLVAQGISSCVVLADPSSSKACQQEQ